MLSDKVMVMVMIMVVVVVNLVVVVLMTMIIVVMIMVVVVQVMKPLSKLETADATCASHIHTQAHLCTTLLNVDNFHPKLDVYNFLP